MCYFLIVAFSFDKGGSVKILLGVLFQKTIQIKLPFALEIPRY
jgi:hypothetical protein